MSLDHGISPGDDPLLSAAGAPAASERFTTAGCPDGESPADGLRQSLQQYRSMLIDYCTLALEPSLSAAAAERMADILAQSVDDPLLSFWLDEADCWVGEQLHLVTEDDLRQQQQKLKRIIGQTWADSLWQDLQNRPKALQAFLQRVGVYSGAIDGVVGPNTRHAIESLKTLYPDDLPLGYL